MTHTVVGLLVAEAALQVRRARGQGVTSEFRAAAMLVSILGNNAPDADSFYASFLTSPLGSLLHHRGHTHTFALAPPLGALAFAVTLGIARLRRHRHDARERLWLLALGVLGALLHVGLDYTNNYGVHPYWPFDNRWIYGDSVFIIEPLLWAALIPPLIFSMESRWAKGTLIAIALFGVGVSWWRDFVPRSMAATVTLLAVATALSALRATPARRAVISGGAALAVWLLFGVCGRVAKASVNELATTDFPRGTTHDVIATPMPANPLCWQIVLIQTEAERYVARSGVAAVVPAWLSSRECPSGLDGDPTAPSRPLSLEARPELVWRREFSAPLAEFRDLARDNCVFSALLIFARAPYWMRDEELGRVAGDVRYDRSAGLDFSDTVLDGVPCPKNLPPWTPPRADLLESR